MNSHEKIILEPSGKSLLYDCGGCGRVYFHCLSNETLNLIVKYCRCDKCSLSIKYDLLKCCKRNKNDLNGYPFIIDPNRPDELPALLQKDKRRIYSVGRRNYFRDRYECPVHKPTLNKVKIWLKKNEFNFKIDIRSLKIKPITEPSQRAKKLNAIFKASFQISQTRHHGYLKWFGWNKIVKDSDFPRFKEDVFYERQVYIPSVNSTLKGRVLPKGHQFTNLMGSFIQADVASNRLIIECGVTTRRNLLLPVKSEAVQTVIWIPFPYKDLNSDWPDFEKEIDAYSISRAEA